MQVVAYIFNGTVLCPCCSKNQAEAQGVDPNNVWDCEDKGVGVMYDTDEADTPTACDDCGALIDHALTEDGLRYVIGILRDQIRRGNRSQVAAEWAEAIRWNGLTPFQAGIVAKHETLPFHRLSA